MPIAAAYAAGAGAGACPCGGLSLVAGRRGPGGGLSWPAGARRGPVLGCGPAGPAPGPVLGCELAGLSLVASLGAAGACPLLRARRHPAAGPAGALSSGPCPRLRARPVASSPPSGPRGLSLVTSHRVTSHRHRGYVAPNTALGPVCGCFAPTPYRPRRSRGRRPGPHPGRSLSVPRNPAIATIPGSRRAAERSFGAEGTPTDT